MAVISWQPVLARRLLFNPKISWRLEHVPPSCPAVLVCSLIARLLWHLQRALRGKTNRARHQSSTLHFFLCSSSVLCTFSFINSNLLEQWSFTGGRQSSLAMSVFLIFRASSIYRMRTCLPDSPQKKQDTWRHCSLFPFYLCHGNSPTSPSPTLSLKNWRRWLIRSQKS